MKTASSSIEMNFANNIMTAEDVLSNMSEDSNLEQNNRGLFNPLPELLDRSYTLYNTAFQFYHKFKFGPHQSARVIKHRVSKKVWDSYFKFTVERNPYDKMVSMYYMNWGKKGIERSGKSFEDWVKRNENIPFNYPLYTWRDKVIVDRVLKYENLKEELGALYKEIGVPFSGLNERAKGEFRKKQPYQDLHTEFTKKKTYDLFKNELELFGYEF